MDQFAVIGIVDGLHGHVRPERGELCGAGLLLMGEGVDRALSRRGQHKGIGRVQGFDAQLLAQHAHGGMAVAPELGEVDLVVVGVVAEDAQRVQLVHVVEVVDFGTLGEAYKVVIGHLPCAVEQDERGRGDPGAGEGAALADQPGQAHARGDKERGQRGQRARVVGRGVAEDGGEEHDRGPDDKKRERVGVLVALAGTQAQDRQGEAAVIDQGQGPIKDRATGQAVGPFHVAGKAEHAEDVEDVVAQGDDGGVAADAFGEDGDFGGVAVEVFGVAQEFNAQGQKDQEGDDAADEQAAQGGVPPQAAARRIAPEEPCGEGDEDKGRKAARGVGPYAEAGEEAAADVAPQPCAAGGGVRAQPGQAKGKAEEDGHGDDADAKTAEVDVPDADSQRQRGACGNQAALALDQAAHQHIGDANGDDAEDGGGQAQGEDVEAEELDQQHLPVGVEDFAAGIGGEKEGAAPGEDSLRVQRVVGFVKLKAGGQHP